MGLRKKINTDKRLVVGVGSALVDILCIEDDAFLDQAGAAKGGMTLVDKKFIENTLAQASGSPNIVPGGSACNTVVGIGKLGGQARFVGKCGKGAWGQRFRDALANNNVDPVLFTSDSPTGRVLSIITPDAQRSMFTYLGASSDTRPEELTKGCFENAAVVHIEGYLLFNPELIMTAVRRAREAGALVSLDLASYTVVEESRELLTQLVHSSIDIVMANEDEARAFTGSSDEKKALEILSRKVAVAIVKVGERGSLIASGNRIFQIDPVGDKRAVDTTGAGDLWASGFIYGLANGYSLEKCGQLGSACGFEVCQVVGAAVPDDGWTRIKKLLEEN